MIYALPFALQGVLMTLDEFYFHRQRVLGRWERLGHPLDTLFFLSCLSVLRWCEPSAVSLNWFAGLSIANCLFITKDEWEHGKLCSPGENWLHAVLFLLHPVMLITAGYLWWTRAPEARPLIAGVWALGLLFMFYQLFYWNVWRRDRQRLL